MLEPEHPQAAVRLYLHPGDPLHREDQVLVCRTCWAALLERIGEPGRADVCASCGVAVVYEGSLHMLEMTGRLGEAPLWQFCREHAVELLNGFRFIEPKMKPQDLALKADFGRS